MTNSRMTNIEWLNPPIRHSSFVIVSFVSYFFFSTCTVCLRNRGLNLLSFSFSPPDLHESCSYDRPFPRTRERRSQLFSYVFQP